MPSVIPHTNSLFLSPFLSQLAFEHLQLHVRSQNAIAELWQRQRQHKQHSLMRITMNKAFSVPGWGHQTPPNPTGFIPEPPHPNGGVPTPPCSRCPHPSRQAGCPRAEGQRRPSQLRWGKPPAERGHAISLRRHVSICSPQGKNVPEHHWPCYPTPSPSALHVRTSVFSWIKDC